MGSEKWSDSRHTFKVLMTIWWVGCGAREAGWVTVKQGGQQSTWGTAGEEHTYMVPLSWKTHSSTLAWKISWTEEQGPWGSQRVRHDWATSLHFVPLGCNNKVSQTGQLISNRNLVLTVLEAGSLRTGGYQHNWWRLSSRVYPHVVEGLGSSVGSLISTLTPFLRLPPYDLNTTSKPHPLTPSSLEVIMSTQPFCRRY